MSYDLAWAAGFFDGEGCTGVHPGDARRTARLRITMSQVGTDCLNRFLQAVGEGRVLGPYGGSRPNENPWMQYAAEGQAAERVLASLWPWLSEPKRQQARDAVRRANEVRSTHLRRFKIPGAQGLTYTDEKGSLTLPPADRRVR